MTKAANKTVPTGQSVATFVNSVTNPERRTDVRVVMHNLAAITGRRPRLWGDSIIGYGKYHYRYESGREGDMPMIGVSPRAKELVIYIMPGVAQFEAELKRLGNTRTGKSCLYIKRLSDVDEDVLRRLMQRSYDVMCERYGRQ
ncbi:MAG: DUF1801 domain-containing protein [Pseudomonadota bacterium]